MIKTPEEFGRAQGVGMACTIPRIRSGREPGYMRIVWPDDTETALEVMAYVKYHTNRRLVAVLMGFVVGFVAAWGMMLI